VSSANAGAAHSSANAGANRVVVLVSIDTEEDNWVPARENLRTENVIQLPRLNSLLERLGARPTYFVAHSVAVADAGSRIIGDIMRCGFAEVGAHLHPWNTPPLDEAFVPRHTMLLNIPGALQRAKLERLTLALEQCLGGWRPSAFRAGRWAIGPETVTALLECGYSIDSSVTPHTSWADEDDGAFYVGAPLNAYRLDECTDVRRPVAGGRLTEIPPSFGFNRAPFGFWGRVHRAFSSRLGRAFMLDRVAASTGFLRHVTLSPETDLVDDMIDLTHALLTSGARHLHLYLHSPSLSPGLTPFVRTRHELDRLYWSIEEYLERVSAFLDIRFATMSEAAQLLATDHPSTAALAKP
jgi:hypothetical protein